MAGMAVTPVRLDAWSSGDLDLLRRINAPAMTVHLGGPETDEQVVARHERYLALADPTGAMFRVTLLPDGEAAGSIGFWEREWRGSTVYETGWSVLPAFQGRGVAVAAAVACAREAAARRRHRWLHAFPGVDHPASNGVCRRAGFTLLGPVDFEYPKGRWHPSNDWRLDLWEVPMG
jgi:RimJ/RimL family protein N-acetyltransferase